jgi:carbonic anhydrase
MSDKKFATAINCMDGRAQLPVIEFLKKKFGVDHVDVITEAGPIKALADDADKETLASIRRRILVSVDKHHSQAIAVVGHHDCAGNPVGEAEQRRQIVRSAAVVRSWAPAAEVLGLWVNEDWQVEEVKFHSKV